MLYSNSSHPLTQQEATAPPASPMEAISGAIGIFRRQFLVIVVVTALGILLGALYVVSAPPTFTAETTILVETRKVQLFHQSAIVDDVAMDGAAMESQLQILRSDGVILSVIKQLHLTEDAEFVDPPPGMLQKIISVLTTAIRSDEAKPTPHAARSASDLTESALEAFQGRLDVYRVGSSYAIAIRFRSSNADRAAEIANAVADAYVTSQREAKSQASIGTSTWLQQRMRELQEQSAAADQAVVDFKNKNNIVTSKGQLINDQELSDLKAQAVAAGIRTSEARARLDRMQSVIGSDSEDPMDGATVTDALNNPIVMKLRSQYLDLSNRLADWSARFGAKHLAVIDLRRQLREVRLSTLKELKQLAETYKSDYEIAKQRQQELAMQLNEAIAQQQSANQAQTALHQLESVAQNYRALYDNFLQRYTETKQQQSFPIAEAQILSRAATPVITSQSKKRLLLGFAAFASFVLGCGIGTLRELSDRVFRTCGQVESALQVDCIAMIPAVEPVTPPRKSGSRRVNRVPMHNRTIQRQPLVMWNTAEAPYSRFAEAMRSIKLAADLGAAPHRVIGVTSALPKEGKSVTAAALAVLIAEVERRAILVDCDLRNPSLSRTLAPGAKLGLVDVISGKASLEEVVWGELSSGLTFLPGLVRSGVAHTSEVLAADATKQLFSRLRSLYDYVIVDLSPLAPVVDVRVTSGLVDGYVFVIEWGRTKIDVVELALKTTRVVYDNLIGVALSKVDTTQLGSFESDRAKYYINKDFSRYGQPQHPKQVILGWRSSDPR